MGNVRDRCNCGRGQTGEGLSPMCRSVVCHAHQSSVATRGGGHATWGFSSHRPCCAMLSHFSHVRPTDCSPPGSSVHGILQARILEQVAISFFKGSSPPRDRTCISYVSCIGRRVLYHQRHPGSPLPGTGGVYSPPLNLSWQVAGSIHRLWRERCCWALRGCSSCFWLLGCSAITPGSLGWTSMCREATDTWVAG